MVMEVSLELEGDNSEGLGALTVMLGQACSGYGAGTVVSALMYLLVDCGTQHNIPKAEFLAEVYNYLSDLYDDMELNNGNSTYN